MNLEQTATQLETAAQRLRDANATLPIGWDESLNLLHVASSLERMAAAVRQGRRQAAIAAKLTIVTRGEAAALLSSFQGRDVTKDAKAMQRKRDVAKNASMARREKAIKKKSEKSDRELREILAVGRSGRPLKEVAEQYWIREATLEKWLADSKGIELVSQEGTDSASGDIPK